MKNRIIPLAGQIFIAPAVTFASQSGVPVIPKGVPVVPTGVVKVARLTGQTQPSETLPNPNQTATRYAVWGTDLGIMWDDGAGRCLIAFGDTYGAGWGGFGGGPPHADWRSNVLAISRDRNPRDGLTFDTMITDRSGHAAELLPSQKIDDDEHTVIPTAGVSVGRRQIMHYMSVSAWPPNRPWLTNHAGLAYSDNGGRTWIKAPTAVWSNDSHNLNRFQMAALVKDSRWIYLFGTPAGRQGAVYLARVPQAKVLEKRAYRYWNGAGFNTAEEIEAQPVVPGPVSELSVAYNRYFRRWLMIYLAPQRDALVLRDAPALSGPWTGEKVLLRGRDYPLPYGGYMHPWFNDGAEFYFTLSEWPLYNVAWMRGALRAAPSAEAGNLVSDGGFEDDTGGAGIGAPWQLDGAGGRDRGLNFARSGRNNAFLRHSATGWNSLAQNVSVQPGQRYRLTAWVRTSPNHRRSAIGVRRPDGTVLQEKYFTRLDAYAPLTLDFTPTRHTTQLQVFVGLRVHNNQDTWIQIDDVSLRPIQSGHRPSARL